MAGRLRQIRAVVIGAGLMGRFHAGAIANAGGTLVAVVDPDATRGRGLAGRDVPTFTSPGELVAAGTPFEVAHVCTPAPTHAELIAAALAAGAHVVAEKPLAPDAATTAALLDAAAAHGQLLVPVHQFLFQPGVRRLQAAAPGLGALVRCVFETTTAGAELTGADPDELVAEILPHPLSLFVRLAPQAFRELDWNVVRPAAGELRAIAWASGTTFELAISARGRPPRAGLEVTATEGTARADLFHGYAVVERGAPTRARKAARPFVLSVATLAHAGSNLIARSLRREAAYPGLRELVRQTYEAIATGAAAPISAEETLAVARGRDAILRAAAAPAPARTPP